LAPVRPLRLYAPFIQQHVDDVTQLHAPVTGGQVLLMDRGSGYGHMHMGEAVTRLTMPGVEGDELSVISVGDLYVVVRAVSLALRPVKPGTELQVQPEPGTGSGRQDQRVGSHSDGRLSAPQQEVRLVKHGGIA
jgi:hypothetical protein